MKPLIPTLIGVSLLMAGCTTQQQGSLYSQELVASEHRLAVETQNAHREEEHDGPGHFSRECHAANSSTRTKRWLTYGAIATAIFAVPNLYSDDERPEEINNTWDDDELPPDIVCDGDR